MNNYSIKQSLVFFLLLAFSAPGTLAASASPFEDHQNSNQNVLEVPKRRRPGRMDRPRHRGIGHAYKHAGKSAGRGSKRFARNIARGKPLKAGKEFGKGMGGFGKGVGKGTGRSGKKAGKKIKHAVK